MADALCGPSNAIQNFKQYTQVDRSLQQDRLAGPRNTAQGFRSHDPRTGSLDADFHAFENAPVNPFPEQFIDHTFPLQPQFQQPASTSWATDFQQLRISDQPLPAEQFRNFAPLVKSTNGGWQNEFIRQPNVQSTVAQGKQVAFDQQNVSSYYPQSQYQSGFMPMSSYGAPMQVQQLPETAQAQSLDQVNGADWSQAFEEAFQDAFNDVEQIQQAEFQQESLALKEEFVSRVDEIASIQEPEQIRIGSDAIDYTEMKDRTVDQETQDASALARVAGELLHNVQHDSSEKFQNSQFLDLMRKIRDRQVEVKNNDFESTAAGGSEAILHSTQQSVPLSDQEIRTAPDPVQNQDTFAFPDMDTVYAPRPEDAIDYSFDSDQFPVQPHTQISHLHPGGKFYPEQSPPGTYASMSGAVSTASEREPLSSISAADFDAVYDENRDLASRFQKTSA